MPIALWLDTLVSLSARRPGVRAVGTRLQPSLHGGIDRGLFYAEVVLAIGLRRTILSSQASDFVCPINKAELVVCSFGIIEGFL